MANATSPQSSPLDINAPVIELITMENATPPQFSPLDINAPAILLVGKTGAGKSTLGNYLLKTSEDENPTFFVSDSFKSVTKKCGSAKCKIGDKVYNIIDTPGIFDTENLNEEILEEIARTIKKCAYGVKAILFMFEAKRFTEEQREVINRIKIFLGEEALMYIISVFSQCNKKQTQEPEYFKTTWNEPVKAFINSVGSRWAISPHPDIFLPDNEVHKQRLEELQNIISSLDGIYTNELLEKARKKLEDNERIAKEAEEKRQREYDEIKRREGEAIARANYERQQAEDEKRAREIRDMELENIKITLNEMISNLNKKNSELSNKVEDLSNKNKRISDENKNLSNKNKNLSDENKGLRKKLNSKGCFWLKTQVKLESGRIIQLSELQIGDRVLSNVRNGIEEFSDVYLIAHIGKLDHEVKFTKVSFTRLGGSKGQLLLTSTHYVFTENLSIIFAQNLRPGETKILVLGDNNRLVSVFVDDVTNELHDEYISFYTRAGSVIASGVLCSCYDDCPQSQTLMDLAFLPVRWWTLIMPSTYREERLHPYVQFLETAYLSFINAMKKGKRLIENYA